jgi:hypothetical protein
MRLHEKVLFLLYFAAMKRCVGDAGTQTETLDRMTAKIISIGNITRKWKHNLDKDKQGNDKLLPFKMNYDVSKKLFSFTSLGGLYELIDIAIVSRTDNGNWRAFIVSYLNCMRLLTLSRDYTPPEVEELDKCSGWLCRGRYRLLLRVGDQCARCWHLFLPLRLHPLKLWLRNHPLKLWLKLHPLRFHPHPLRFRHQTWCECH